MATTNQTFACIASAYADAQNQSANNYTASSYELPYASSNPSRLYLKFDAFPENLKRCVLIDAVVYDNWSFSAPNYSYFADCNIGACESFDETTLTFSNKPKDITTLGHTQIHQSPYLDPVSNPAPFPKTKSSSVTGGKIARSVLTNMSVWIARMAGQGYSSTHVSLNTRRATNKPTLEVSYDPARIVEYQCKSYLWTSGFVNRFIDNTFSWSIVKAVDEDYCVADPEQVSAIFHWRAGTSGDFTEIAIPDGTKEVTIPAGTFPSGDVQWYVTAVDQYGYTLPQAAIYTVSTLVGDLSATPASPINGAFADPAGISTFSWTNINAHNVTTQSAAELQYSTDKISWSTLGSVTGASQIYAVPAGTFPNAGTYYWRVRATNVDGVTGPWSSAAEFSTVDTTMFADPLHPVSEIRDYTAPITFEWTYHSDTGTIPQQTDLQTSLNGVDWDDTATLGAGILSYTVPAGTYSAGTVYWRVRSYNSNNVVGPWSDSVSFIAFGAPPQPSVSVDAVPFAVIHWQSTGQIAYKVTVDGRDFGPYFGTAKNFTLHDYLSDGPHTVGVSIQGAYGLWSPVGEIQFVVENEPGTPIDLNAILDRDAVLNWYTTDETADFLVYRDGIQIAHTAEMTFSDRVVLGDHAWYVINRLSDGNYSKSETVEGTLRTSVPAIAALSGGEWQDLRLSTDENRTERYNKSQTVSLRQFAGQVYPTAEISPYRTMRVDFDVAWTWAESRGADFFEDLIGKVVIFKTPTGEAIVGMLSAWNRESAKFYRAYTAAVQRVHWRDWIDADD